MEQADQQTIINGQLSAEDIDVEVLPLIYEILRGIERESIDVSQKPRDSQDTSSSKIIELQKKLTHIREQVLDKKKTIAYIHRLMEWNHESHYSLPQRHVQIQKLPGIEYNRTDQLKQLDTLRKQLKLKRELLLKYRNMCSFEMPKA